MEPALFVKPWGGHLLAKRYGKRAAGPSATEPIGEAWEISGRDEGSSRVRTGPLAGRTLAELVREYPREILGDAATRSTAPPRFPLLLKILDCRETLSVQVHPDDARARAKGDLGKEEAWVVLEATPDAALYLGFTRPVTEAEVRDAIAQGTLPALMRKVSVEPGEVYHLVPGTVHAIGAGCLLAEIQQSSDLTYRLYDWGRVGLDGQPRALHIEESLACAKLRPGSCACHARAEDVPGGALEALIRGRHFALDRLHLDGRHPRSTHNVPLLVLALDGAVQVASAAGKAELGPASSALVPACAEGVALTGRATVLLAYPPTR